MNDTHLCLSCRLERPFAEFAKGSAKAKNGLYSYCRSCQRSRWASWKYGITFDEAEILYLTAQCDICAKPFTDAPKQRHIDHDHETNTIRGVLCKDCNVHLAYFGDDLEGVMRVVDYLSTPLDFLTRRSKLA